MSVADTLYCNKTEQNLRSRAFSREPLAHVSDSTQTMGMVWVHSSMGLSIAAAIQRFLVPQKYVTYHEGVTLPSP